MAVHFPVKTENKNMSYFEKSHHLRNKLSLSLCLKHILKYFPIKKMQRELLKASKES